MAGIFNYLAFISFSFISSGAGNLFFISYFPLGAGNLSIVKLLVRVGAQVNHCTRSLSTPIRYCCCAITELSVISILWLKCIYSVEEKNIINVSLLFSVKPSKTTSFHQERHWPIYYYYFVTDNLLLHFTYSFVNRFIMLCVIL